MSCVSTFVLKKMNTGKGTTGVPPVSRPRSRKTSHSETTPRCPETRQIWSNDKMENPTVTEFLFRFVPCHRSFSHLSNGTNRGKSASKVPLNFYAGN